MKIFYNSFTTKSSQGGALYFYSEISRLLSTWGEDAIECHPLDFSSRACRDPGELVRLFAKLGPDDVVVCNAGPYGHLYHYLRELAGSRFRIIRDVRTSSWGGFLLQEALAAPLSRPGDLVLFPSEFCRAYFMKFFPQGLTRYNTAVCYPLMDSFPAAVARHPEPGFNVGYIGRMSGDKNFSKVLEIFEGIHRHRSDARLHLAGPMDKRSKYGSLERIVSRLQQSGVPADRVSYAGQLPYEKIWPFFAKLDLFVFPAMSSVESLGRVLLEARHANVPVISVDYAAAGEIVPPSHLVAPVFNTSEEFDGNKPFSFGSIDVELSVQAALRSAPAYQPDIDAPYQSDTFYGLVRGERAPGEPKALSHGTRHFLDHLSLRGARLDHDHASAMKACRTLLSFYGAYNHASPWRRTWHLMGALHRVIHAPESPALRLDRLLNGHAAFELRHAREFCRTLDFHPVFKMMEAAVPTAQAA